MAIDDFSRHFFPNNVSTKKRSSPPLLIVIAEKNGISPENSTREMTQYSVPDEDGIHGFAVHLSLYLAEMIVSELIQVKIFTGSEKKIRIAKAVKRDCELAIPPL